jgi:hypothetical protein
MGVFDLLLGNKRQIESNQSLENSKIDLDGANHSLIELYEKYNFIQKQFFEKYNEVIKSLDFFNEELINNSNRRKELIQLAEATSKLKNKITIKYGLRLNYYSFFNELEIKLNKLLNDRTGNIFNIHDKNKHLFEKYEKILNLSDDKYVEEIHSITYKIINLAKRTDFENTYNNKKRDIFLNKIIKINRLLDDVNRKSEYQIRGLKNHIFHHSNNNKKINEYVQEIKNLKNKYKEELTSDNEVSEIYFKIIQIIENGFSTLEYGKIWTTSYENFNKDKILIEKGIEISRKLIYEFLNMLNEVNNTKERFKEPAFSNKFI